MKKLWNLCLVLIFILTVVLFPGIASAEKLVAVILTGAIPYYEDIHSSFEAELKALGVGDVKLLVQKPTHSKMAWTNAARKAVSYGVDVIVTYGGASTVAVSAETSKVPIVFAGVYDPKTIGLGGKNMTGISSKVPMAGVLKNLEAIKKFQRLGVVFSGDEKDAVAQVDDISRLEGQFNFETVRFDVRSTEDISNIKGVDAIFVSTSCTAQQCISGIIGIARNLKAPTASPISGGEEMGIVLTIFPKAEEQGKSAARAVSRILKGESPNGIPVETPKEIDMVVNLKETRELGLKVPMDVLTSASKVIK